MEETDIFTFCQHDLQKTSFTVFQEMRKEGKFCDLTIKVQNQSITAHRIVVAAGIPYFQSTFDSTHAESEEKEIAVKNNLDPKALESLILFAYTGRVDITAANVQSLLVTAQFLELDQIRDSCTAFLSERLNIHNVGQIRKLAINLNNSHLTDNCNRYIRKNFEDFSKTSDFSLLSHSCVKEIISMNDLNVASEEVAFEAIIKWVNFSPSVRNAGLPELLTEIRMIYLPVKYLMQRVDAEKAIVNSTPCKDLINEVKYYHVLSHITGEFFNLKTRPRNCFLPCLYAVCSCKVDNSYRLFIFNLVSEKWLPLSSMELKTSVCKVVAVNDKIYMLLDKNVQIFDPGNQEWQLLESSHESIEGTAIVFHEGNIYCFGAEDDDFINKMRVLDTQSNKWSQTKDMKTSRWDAAAASLGEFIYVTGGYDDGSRIKSAEKYCPNSDLWTDIAPMLTERDRHGCTSMNGKIYVCGGMDSDDTTLNLAEVYDPCINQWQYIFRMQNSKIVVSLVQHCGRIYAFGETECEVYDPELAESTECSFVRNVRGAVSVSTLNIQDDTA